MTARPLLRHVGLLAALALPSAGGCDSFFDPTHAAAVDALGAEAPGERPGPLHRAGQPCGVCHGGHGPGPDLLGAGTVYERDESTVPAVGVTVVVTDKTGATSTATTNRVGNFILGRRGSRDDDDDGTPPATGATSFTYPIQVELRSGSFKKAMSTPIGRDPFCGSCHHAPPDERHAPPVYLRRRNEP